MHNELMFVHVRIALDSLFGFDVASFIQNLITICLNWLVDV